FASLSAIRRRLGLAPNAALRHHAPTKLGEGMKFHHLALALAFSIGTASAAPHETWLGAWGYPATPAPPGKPDPVIPSTAPVVPQSLLPITDGAPTAVTIVPTNQTPELSHVTLRQIVRVAAGGGRLRLRLSNEGGTDPLPLTAVHVAEAGAD